MDHYGTFIGSLSELLVVGCLLNEVKNCHSKLGISKWEGLWVNVVTCLRRKIKTHELCTSPYILQYPAICTIKGFFFFLFFQWGQSKVKTTFQVKVVRRAYPTICSMKKPGVLLFFQDSILVHYGSSPHPPKNSVRLPLHFLTSLETIYTPMGCELL